MVSVISRDTSKLILNRKKKEETINCGGEQEKDVCKFSLFVMICLPEINCFRNNSINATSTT